MSRPRRSIQPSKYSAEVSESEAESMDIGKMSQYNSDSEESSTFEGPEEDPSEISEPYPVPVPVATETEVSHTRALVAQHRQKVALLRTKYQEQKKITEELDSRLRAAERRLFEVGARIAPVSRVPLEILGLIFTLHVRENKQSPWLLMQVSRMWRAAALMTRVIWGRILLAPPNWVKSKTGKARVRVYDGMEVCFKQAQLTRALKRAGATPLDLKVEFSREVTRRRWMFASSGNDPELLALLNSILNHQANARLRSLSVATEIGLPLPAKIFDEFNFADLVSLELDREYPEVMKKVVNESGGLRRLHVQSVSLSKMRGYEKWDQLEELGINDLHLTQDRQLLRSVVSSGISLISLTLASGTITGPGQGDQLIYLPTLKHLELNDVSTLWPIDCPNLTHLALHSVPGLVALAPRSIDLPHLIELALSGFNVSEDILRGFKIPSLHKFDFQCGNGKTQTARVFKSIWPTYTTPLSMETRSFSLRNTRVNEKVLSCALARQDRLEDFSAIEVVIGTQFFDGLLPTVIETKKSKAGKKLKWEVGCPALRRIEIDLVTRKKIKHAQAEVEGKAKALIVARKKAGAPLDRLAMRFSKEEGWKEFVGKGIAV